MKNFLILLSLIFLSGCGIGQHFISSYKPTDAITMHSYSDDLQNVFFKTEKNPVKFCLEPSPDVALATNEGISLPSSAGSLGIKDEGKDTALGGRGDLSLVARELSYRACEMSLNNDANLEQTTTIYQMFLDALVKISQNIGKTSDNEKTDDSTDDDDES